MNVSVIIPAHNAAETITETLESLRIQTFQNWEAIVVDDGSNDGTTAIVARFAEQDHRISMVSQPKMGVSAARNRGISLSRFNWLLFLDADDWILPSMLERLTSKIISDPNLDAVYCSWARVAPDGRRFGEEFCENTGDLFELFSRTCAFAIHACIVRKACVEAVGGFSTSLQTCEDWYLWQRITRTGARFGSIREVLSLYRMRPASASVNGHQLLADGILVQALGHRPDPFLPNLAYPNGQPAERLPTMNFYLACWAAGLVLGHGEDARPLLNMLKDSCSPCLEPYGIALSIFKAALLPSCRTPTDWTELWQRFGKNIKEFLQALEVRSAAPILARRTQAVLEDLILEHTTAPLPLIIGTKYVVRIEVTKPICDIDLPVLSERLYCIIELEGARIGTIELPACGKIIPGYVISDAIAAEFTWQIIGKFFEHTIYCDLSIERRQTGLSLRRGTILLGEGLSEDEHTFWEEIHDKIGWTVFLQEICGRPNWPMKYFYNSKITDKTDTSRAKRIVNDNWLTIEVSEDIPNIKTSGQQLYLVITVKGAALGVIPVPVKQKIIRAQEIRTMIMKACGLELCRVAVREGLLGRSVAEPIPLRSRLSASTNMMKDHLKRNQTIKISQSINLAPNSDLAIQRALLPYKQGIVLARHRHGAIGTSVSRRAALPIEAIDQLSDAASIFGLPMVQVSEPNENPAHVVYAPELIWHSHSCVESYATNANGSEIVQKKHPLLYDQTYFETIFAKKIDPWKYTTPYERTKYEQTIALIPKIRIQRALEIACAEGIFTVLLAPLVEHLIAADISQIALDRAAQRCIDFKNVDFKHLDLTKDPLPERFDLIVCSEVLYFIGDRTALRKIASKITDALEPGGYFITAHANLVVDEPDKTGFDWDHSFGAKVIGETFARIPSLRFVKELRTPFYRIQLFQRSSRIRLFFRRNTPEIIELPQPAQLLPEVAKHVLWNGKYSQQKSSSQNFVTDRLPILMYHRIASDGLSSTARYRVTPEAFEEQLHYLRDEGYYSVELEEWRTAKEAYKSLPGRALLITFDDGYFDFLTRAWPLLKQYGFSATVFLVADAVGRTNIWDRVYDEEIPLLGWEEIRQLRIEGVNFGSHSYSHRPLTALSAAEIIREGTQSWTMLRRELGLPITAFAYPYGDEDKVTHHLIGACGYIFGLSCRPGLSEFRDPLLALPRIEITGSDNLQSFVTKLNT